MVNNIIDQDLLYLPKYLSCLVTDIKYRVELRKRNNAVASSREVFGSLKLKIECKVFDRIPNRISISMVDFEICKSTKKLEVGVEGGKKFLRGYNNNGVLCSAATNVMARDNAIEFISRCSKERNLELGRVCHALIVKNGYGDDKFVSTNLVNMYAKCGEMDNAMTAFSEMLQPDIASCNCLISGYACNGLVHEAFGFFAEIADKDISPNHYTYSIMLSVCATVLALQEGRQLHSQVVKIGFLPETPVVNSLLTMYSKCGGMEAAESLFESLSGRNLVSWTTIISGFYRGRAFEKALRKFSLMRENGIEPNEYTFPIALACCGSMKHLDNGRALQAQVVKKGMVSDVFLGTAIIDMYSGFSEMGDAEKQLRVMGKTASEVSWNALITGFVCNHKAKAAMEAFHKMVENDTKCNKYTYSISLKACSSLPSLTICRQIHSRLAKAKLETNNYVGSSLIEAYAKCGNLEDAEQVFNQITKPDIVSWNSIIKAYAQYGYPEKAIYMFNKLIEAGERPSSSTFLAVLSACSHSGLLQEGQRFFKYMVRDYHIPPEETHYSCIVDLLGRSGRLEKALDFIINLPMEPTAPIWRPLLAACRYHSNLELAEVVANRIFLLEPNDATVYVALSNMYADVGRGVDAEKQRVLMEARKVLKEPGCSWIEVNNKTYKFFSGDKTFPDMPKVYKRLKELIGQIKDTANSAPYTPSVISSEIRKSNDERVQYHSEKLAVCFGLINLPAGTPVRIFKNLRVCSDCHLTMKYISKSTKREIVLRDNYRFHHFKHGSCSCRDFW